MDNQAKPAEYQDALTLVREEKFVYLSSLDEGGGPETRVLFNLRETCAEAFLSGPAALDNDFATYLGTNSGSRKAAQLRRDGRVCLYYSNNNTFQGLSLRGNVEEVGDRAKKEALWRPGWEMYYQGGLDGGDFCLMLFKPTVGRYYHGLKVVEFAF